MPKSSGYVIQPRGKPLYEDEGSFGAKMLSKMGWSKGKGLGANEDGKQEFIRVKYKNDIGGFGYTTRDDQWTENESGFHSLLENLNVSADGKQSTEVKVASLEEKSKTSRARVHYHKFTRGKDLSRYSEKDLANILGKKSLNEKKSEADEESKDSVEEEKDSSSSMIINTGVSITDYFKNKRKLKNQEVKSVEEKIETNTQEIESGDSGISISVVLETKKKAKKERNVEAEAETTEVQAKSKKRKRKNDSIDEGQVAQIEAEMAELAALKAKKKKKRSKTIETIDLSEEIEKSEPIERVEKVEVLKTDTMEASEAKEVNLTVVTSFEKLETIAPQDDDPNSYFMNPLGVQMLKNLKLETFRGSNVSNIVGYGLNTDIKLKMKDSKIVKGITQLDKYSIYAKVDKVHSKKFSKTLLLRHHKKRNVFKL